MRLIIAGDRKYSNRSKLYNEVDKFILSLVKDETEEIELIGGGAKGADELGEEYAIEFEFDYRTFKADWDAHGKAAGPIRNREMAEYTSQAPDKICACIVFDGGGPGSANMIKTAKAFGLILRVIKV